MSRAEPLVERLVEVGLEAVALAVDDAPLEPLAERQRGELLGAGLAARAAASTPSNRSRKRCSGS